MSRQDNAVKLMPKGASAEITKDGFEPSLKGIQAWLFCKNILKKNEVLLEYKDIVEWHKFDSKSYFTVFRIKHKDCKDILQDKKIGIKAIISIPVEESLKLWSRNRSILKNKSIPVSNWYWYGNGIIIEDFYPKTVEEINRIESIYSIAYKLDTIGYSSFSGLLNDIKCDKQGDPYVIDFGFNIINNHKKSAFYSLIEIFPEQKKPLEEFYFIKEQSFSSNTHH